MPLQLRRGDEGDRAGITPADGEPLIIKDGSTYKLYVGDGSTAGGHLVSGGSGGTVSPLTTKGDLFVYGSGQTRLPVGSNGQVLTADSGQATGVKWAALPTLEVTAFTQAVDGDGNELQNVRIVGNVDVPYDLGDDPANLVAGGVATLSPLYNFYYVNGLDDSLTIDLPSPEAGTAPYGQVSVSLGDSGNLSIEDPVVWGKTDPNDPDGVIPLGDGQAFTLFYRYDPTVAKYVMNIEYLDVIEGGGGGTPPAGVVQLVAGSAKQSSIANANRHDFNFTHNYTSTTQDGSVWLVVVFVGDRVSGSDYTPDSKVTVVNDGTVTNYDPRVIIAIYKPTQADLNRGTEALLFTSDHPASGETGQFLTFEIKGANATNPVDTTNENGSPASRSSVGPTSTTASQDDSLLVVVAGAGNLTGGGAGVNISVTNLNSFTEVGHYTDSAGVACEFYVHAKEVDVGSHSSPTYGVSPDAPLQLLTAVFKP